MFCCSDAFTLFPDKPRFALTKRSQTYTLWGTPSRLLRNSHWSRMTIPRFSAWQSTENQLVKKTTSLNRVYEPMFNSGTPGDWRQMFTESHSIPEVSLPNSSNTTTYAVVCVDIDVPFPSWDMLGPALHWFQPGLEATVDGVTRNVDNTPAIADYLGASPLPGSSRRRYLVILYEQGHYLNIQNGGNLLYPGSDPVWFG